MNVTTSVSRIVCPELHSSSRANLAYYRLYIDGQLIDWQVGPHANVVFKERKEQVMLPVWMGCAMILRQTLFRHTA